MAMSPCKCCHASTQILTCNHANVAMPPWRCGHASMETWSCLNKDVTMLPHICSNASTHLDNFHADIGIPSARNSRLTDCLGQVDQDNKEHTFFVHLAIDNLLATRQQLPQIPSEHHYHAAGSKRDGRYLPMGIMYNILQQLSFSEKIFQAIYNYH